ncbi:MULTISPECIES: 4Fe-4S single cluster domain-containing protein [unclassified Nonomuraea]|uniref:4Fe-4S single cluster domain-containing protein n=1 Tax=unclassified Nonomuraea TaxID=2593643 RepID=UPI00340F56F8
MLNVAEICTATRALGPGVRAVVWVQGCPFHCRGCLAPDWIPDRPAREMTPDELAAALLSDPRVTGLTFSGGEPMAQAAGLAETARAVRAVKEVSLICFTGFRLEELAGRPAAGELLAEVDVLIDGRYVASRNDDRGLRGSANQRVHHLTDRLRGLDFTGTPRRAELHVNDRDVLLVGVPPSGLTAAWNTIGRDGT